MFLTPYVDVSTWNRAHRATVHEKFDFRELFLAIPFLKINQENFINAQPKQCSLELVVILNTRGVRDLSWHAAFDFQAQASMSAIPSVRLGSFLAQRWRAHRGIALGVCIIACALSLRVALWGPFGKFSRDNDHAGCKTLTWPWWSLEGRLSRLLPLKMTALSSFGVFVLTPQ
jgi:hypothetical protein